MPPGRPRKDAARDAADELAVQARLGLREFMEKQNVIAHALSVQHEMTQKQVQASFQQLGVISEAMTQVQAFTKEVVEGAGVTNYGLFDGSFPAISRLLRQDTALLNPLGQLPLLAGGLGGAGLGGLMMKEKKKRKRKEKHPDAPKQPITAYFLFLEANRERIRAELPEGTSAGDIQKRGTVIWNEMAPDEKEVYRAQYRKNFEHYKEELDKYRVDSPGGQYRASANVTTSVSTGSRHDKRGVARLWGHEVEESSESEEENEDDGDEGPGGVSTMARLQARIVNPSINRLPPAAEMEAGRAATASAILAGTHVPSATASVPLTKTAAAAAAAQTAKARSKQVAATNIDPALTDAASLAAGPGPMIPSALPPVVAAAPTADMGAPGAATKGKPGPKAGQKAKGAAAAVKDASAAPISSNPNAAGTGAGTGLGGAGAGAGTAAAVDDGPAKKKRKRKDVSAGPAAGDA